MTPFDCPAIHLQGVRRFADRQSLGKAFFEDLRVVVEHGLEGLLEKCQILAHGQIFLPVMNTDVLLPFPDEPVALQVHAVIFADVLGVVIVGFTATDEAIFILVVNVSEGLALGLRKAVLVHLADDGGVDLAPGLADVFVPQLAVHLDLLAEGRVAAVMFALRKKWLLFVAGIAVATLIHPYALMYLLVPFMEFRPWTKKTYWMLTIFLAAGFLLRPLLGTVVNITTLLGEEYTVTSFAGEGVNIFRVLVCNVPLVLSYIYRKKLFADSSTAENLMINLTMLNGAIMFVGLFGTANYFARLANYFLIFQSLSLPWMLKKIGGRDRKMLTALMVLGFLAYFYYANVLAIPFDQDFARLSLPEYLAQLK